MSTGYRRRKHDGMVAVWRSQASSEQAMQWVCIAVVDTVSEAVIAMRKKEKPGV